MTRCLLCLLVLIALSALAVPAALAADSDLVVPPGLAPSLTGMSYAAWGDAWWQWVAAIPGPADPRKDLTGQNATVGQGHAGPVFFLVNRPWDPSAPEMVIARSVNVPAGRFILVPVNNLYYMWAWPGCEANCCKTLTEFEACAPDGVAAALDAMTGLYASVDGVPIGDLSPYRTESEDFYTVWIPAEKMKSVPGTTPGSGATTAFEGGYYLLLYPLSRGKHDIRFGVSQSCCGWDVTYHVTVE